MSIDEHSFRAMSLEYRKSHTRGACRVRWDAFDLALHYLASGRSGWVTVTRIHATINGGRCAPGPVRAAIADARRQYACAAEAAHA